MFKTCFVVGAVVLATAFVRAQTPSPDQTPSIVGAWTLNKDLSDQPQDRRQDDRDSGDSGRRGGGYGRRGGGGFGGGSGRGGFGGGDRGGGMNREDMQRMRDAMRDIMNPADHLTITQSGTTVVITTNDGRTTRLSTDGKKIKDESTKIERKTKWDGGKLVSEISGLGPGKITETYAIDPEQKQLRLTVQVENSRRPMTLNRVYDRDHN